MHRERIEKLERYLRNANQFMWGLGVKDQRRTYEWLETSGFTDRGVRFKHSYSDTTDKLIKDYGIERIMHDIVRQRIEEMFGPSVIDFLRNCWQAGVRPTVEMLKANRFEYILEEKTMTGKEVDRDPESFLLYNRQFRLIRGWGELAGIWFEEIEPYLTRSGESVISQESRQSGVSFDSDIPGGRPMR